MAADAYLFFFVRAGPVFPGAFPRILFDSWPEHRCGQVMARALSLVSVGSQNARVLLHVFDVEDLRLRTNAGLIGWDSVSQAKECSSPAPIQLVPWQDLRWRERRRALDRTRPSLVPEAERVRRPFP